MSRQSKTFAAVTLAAVTLAATAIVGGEFVVCEGPTVLGPVRARFPRTAEGRRAAVTWARSQARRVLGLTQRDRKG